MNQPKLEARRFLMRLSSFEETPSFTFQTYDDANTNKSHLTRMLHGSFDEHCDELVRLNNEGAGIFVTLNRTDCLGRKTQNIIDLRACFADDDSASVNPENLHLTPSMIVQSKRGLHIYYCLKPGQSVGEFSSTQKAISLSLKTDPKVCDLPRCVRIPGFLHVKDPYAPYAVSLREVSNENYTIEELRTAFWFDPTSKSICQQQNIITPHPQLSGFKVGNRDAGLFNYSRDLLARGNSLEEVTLLAEAANLRSEIPLQTSQVVTKVRQAVKYVRENTTPADLADLFLNEECKNGDNYTIKYYHNEFFQYSDDRYLLVSYKELASKIVLFLQTRGLKKFAIQRTVNDVILNIAASVQLSTLKTPPFIINGENIEAKQLICLKNGVIDVDTFLQTESVELISHSPSIFSLSCLPYAYDKNTECPIFLKFLFQMIPDEETRNFLQEFFGYLLIHDTTQEKCVIIKGEGANGKSVLLLVLQTLLGEENVAALGLECFNPIRTFPLAALEGKLANICEEINEVHRAAEGLLKQIVSGGSVTIERKFRDPYTVTLTCRLIFATNILPRFTDSTAGLWRRIVIIPMTQQILDPTQQDKRFKQPSFWIESGELEGIFCWALKGLIRLKNRGHFVEPATSFNAKEVYRESCNPTHTFLRDHLESISDRGSIASNLLYYNYAQWALANGYKPFAQNRFAEEVKRVFPATSLTKHPQTVADGTRTRLWHGIAWIDLKTVRFGLPLDNTHRTGGSY